jgi:hypothetical protein
VTALKIIPYSLAETLTCFPYLSPAANEACKSQKFALSESHERIPLFLGHRFSWLRPLWRAFINLRSRSWTTNASQVAVHRLEQGPGVCSCNTYVRSSHKRRATREYRGRLILKDRLGPSSAASIINSSLSASSWFSSGILALIPVVLLIKVFIFHEAVPAGAGNPAMRSVRAPVASGPAETNGGDRSGGEDRRRARPVSMVMVHPSELI